MVPFPKTSQAKPTRGAKLFLSCAPQAAHWTLIGDLHGAVANLVEQRAAGSKVEVRVQRWVGVVLHTVVLPAHAQVQGQALGCFPRILQVEVAIVVAVVAAE